MVGAGVHVGMVRGLTLRRAQWVVVRMGRLGLAPPLCCCAGWGGGRVGKLPVTLPLEPGGCSKVDGLKICISRRRPRRAGGF